MALPFRVVRQNLFHILGTWNAQDKKEWADFLGLNKLQLRNWSSAIIEEIVICFQVMKPLTAYDH